MSVRHRLLVGFCLAAWPGCAAPTLGQPDSPILERVLEIAGTHEPVVQAMSIGVSREGRTLHLLRVAGRGDLDPEQRPAMLIVAGLDPMHRVGTEVALGMAERLAADHADALSHHTVYIVPLLNPDTWVYLSHPGVPTWDFSRTLTPDDADRDGRVDEDGPEDLNNDGHITMMRVRDSSPGSGLTATLMIDPDEPRLMRPPDPMKGERATHAVLLEGRDTDGDGRFNEDPVGGVHLDMNFPAHWPEFADGAGRFPLSEPETKALADWMLAKDTLLGVVIFTPKDTIVRVPEAGRMEASGRVPLGIENDDRATYEAISTLFKEVTKMRSAPTGDAAGSLWSWAYAHLGLYTYSTPVWVRPDQLEHAEAPRGERRRDEVETPARERGPDPEQPPRAASAELDEIRARINEFRSASEERQREMMGQFESLPAQQQARIMEVMRAMQDGLGNVAAAEQPGTGRGRPTGAPPARPAGAQPGGGAPPARAAASEDAAWLKYSDEHRDGAGFVTWTALEHPQLGQVEIGGFVAGFKLNPPPEEIPRLVGEQTDFLVKLIGKMPLFVVEDPLVERVADGVWRVWLTVRNDGFLPLRQAIAVKARRLTPIVIRHDVPEDRLLSGRRVDNTATSLAGSGGKHVAEWIVRGNEGDVVTFEVSVPEFGRREVRAELREAGR